MAKGAELLGWIQQRTGRATEHVGCTHRGLGLEARLAGHTAMQHGLQRLAALHGYTCTHVHAFVARASLFGQLLHVRA